MNYKLLLSILFLLVFINHSFCADLTTINSIYVTKTESTASIRIDTTFTTNYSSNVKVYYDLIEGSIPNCQKLTCGNPSNDNECNRGF